MKIIVWLTATACVAIGIAVVVSAIRKQQLQTGTDGLVEERMRKAYDVYVNGSFREATNELSSYLVFLANTPEEIRRSRDVDALMYIAHEKLAYMMMVASNKNAACAQLRDAYKLHQRQMIKTRFDLIPRTNFVESVVQGVEAVDAKTGVKWKSERPLNANVVREVNLLFLSPKNASSEPSMN